MPGADAVTRMPGADAVTRMPGGGVSGVEDGVQIADHGPAAEVVDLEQD
jgi:hypothetical protein